MCIKKSTIPDNSSIILIKRESSEMHKLTFRERQDSKIVVKLTVEASISSIRRQDIRSNEEILLKSKEISSHKNSKRALPLAMMMIKYNSSHSMNMKKIFYQQEQSGRYYLYSYWSILNLSSPVLDAPLPFLTPGVYS